jgi:hypothetical protein
MICSLAARVGWPADVVVDADLERLTRLAKAARIEFGKLGNALVHVEPPPLAGNNLLQPDRFSKFKTSTATERRWCLGFC